MDIDAAKRTQRLPPSCYRCGKVGHIKSECKQGYDIQHLDRDDIEALLEQLNVRLDVLDAQVVPNIEDESIDRRAIDDDVDEGFQRRNE